MRTQIIHHDYDLLSLREMDIDQVFHTLRPIRVRSAICDFDMPPVVQWREEHEQVADPVALKSALVALRLTHLQRQRRFDLDMLLFIALIEADLRAFGIEGSGVDRQQVFHRSDEASIGFRWDLPFDFQPGLEFVFLRIVRTVSSEIAATSLSSMSLSASSCIVHCLRSSGGELHVQAISVASALPSSLRLPPGRGRSVRAASGGRRKRQPRAVVERARRTGHMDADKAPDVQEQLDQYGCPGQVGDGACREGMDAGGERRAGRARDGISGRG